GLTGETRRFQPFECRRSVGSSRPKVVIGTTCAPRPVLPHSRPSPTARAFKSATKRGPVKGMARTHAQLGFCALKLSAIRAVRATLLSERGCKLDSDGADSFAL